MKETIKKWKDGTYRYKKRIILQVASFGNDFVWVYKISGRIVLFN